MWRHLAPLSPAPALAAGAGGSTGSCRIVLVLPSSAERDPFEMMRSISARVPAPVLAQVRDGSRATVLRTGGSEKEALMAKTVADLLVERLIEWGVDTIFGFPGDGINGIFEALRKHQKKIRFIQVRHEEAAAFAACGYAKYTGRLGVCLATSGPGGIHLLNGLYDAKCDGQPVLAITGHTFHDLIGTHYQQDVDLDKLFMDVAVYNQRVMGPAHVVNVVDEAIKTALGLSHRRAHHDSQGHAGLDGIGRARSAPM